ncbi:MAG: type II toxin-antitoxin system VapC family toxin [Actinomycetota bacterium]
MDSYKKKLDDKNFIVNESKELLSGYEEIIVLDTSVVVKWFFKEKEKNVQKAKAILNEYLNQKIRIIVPELLLFELANVIKTRLKGDKISNQSAIIENVFNLGIVYYVDKKILIDSIKTATIINGSVYDAIFLETARRFKGKLVTADHKLYKNCIKCPQNMAETRLLADYNPK